MKTVDFFFDYSCPYAYLASTQIEALCERTKSQLVWKPMLLGGIFRELGSAQNQAHSMSAQKAQHNGDDMRRWADLWKVALTMPANHPMRTVDALRATLATPIEHRTKVIHSLYQMYWVDNQDIADHKVIAAALSRAGVDGASLVASIDQSIKDQLKANTDEALSRGIFGAPSVCLGEDMYWGQDRLWMVERALGGEPEQPGQGRFHRATQAPPVDFWFDFSSPFTYLASTQIEDICARRKAKLNWRPMLLGAIFKSLGGPNAPIETFSPPKQRYQLLDLQRWAEYWGVPFGWPTRFPMKTVKALRIALALGDKMLPFVHGTFRAYWSEDRDLEDDATLRDILQENGLDASFSSAGEDPTWKQALITSTQAAIDAGVFGAPTMIVDGKLFWGQDRLFLLERVLEGWAG